MKKSEIPGSFDPGDVELDVELVALKNFSKHLYYFMFIYLSSTCGCGTLKKLTNMVRRSWNIMLTV